MNRVPPKLTIPETARPASRAAALSNEAAFSRALLGWYEGNRRSLPWRETGDPYRIWVSEIMLQQTRVAAARPFYEEFLRRFPTVSALARAPLRAVLAAWSGLGYYRRARMLHAAAKQLTRLPQFPRSSVELEQLPGIGAYTAAAIASIAFGEPCAAVDGNVERVVARLAGRSISRKQAGRAAQRLVSPSRPGDFNQAMMDLGAAICTPRAPQCAACPVRSFCRTVGEHKPRPRRPRSRRAVACVLAVRRNRLLLIRRSDHESRLAGMWELPAAVPGTNGRDAASAVLRLRHSILNTDYRVSVYAMKDRHAATLAPGARWISISRLPELPLTGLARKILQRTQLLPSLKLPSAARLAPAQSKPSVSQSLNPGYLWE
ncbi:MAG: A/G-specific adenine glycosylase [Acidobacteria bacterium]|nr:A/G-specific adenine glycosylase [Acidobacteriota bacterium]